MKFYGVTGGADIVYGEWFMFRAFADEETAPVFILHRGKLEISNAAETRRSHASAAYLSYLGL
jgi:hypothetical protein